MCQITLNKGQKLILEPYDHIEPNDNKHNCQLCGKEFLGRCHCDKTDRFGKDVSMKNTPCEYYDFKGTDKRLKKIEGPDIIQSCKFTSVWDGGDEITTDATVNLYTREVIAECVDPDNLGYECNVLDNEFITMKDGTTHAVYAKDDCNPKEDFWYK